MFYYEGEHLTSRLVQFAGYDAECPEHDRWEPVQPTPLPPPAPVAAALAHLRPRLHWPGSQLPLQTFYQHEIRRVDDQFPCPDLTLQALGIPDREVLVVEQAHEQCYIELTGCQSINH